ncbi:LAMI_0H12288g1_1 [Lachancea mirantina]|uniref:LAMI_0H12288g1_1 n=1 Tax=Lachancea mirantina TaxID=1230905 RepID=A0A1G4KHR6_9SACH|nr:LAMI_0H12288g1_1 [Lachancea mirantina]
MQNTSINDLYGVCQEYRRCAQEIAPLISTQQDLEAYYTLIWSAIRVYQRLKEEHQLSTEQDVKITLELSQLLVDETNELDLAEGYLFGAKERLQQTTSLQEKMAIEYALAELAQKRGTSSHLGDAVRNLESLINDLQKTESPWALVFKYKQIDMLAKTAKPQRIALLYNDLIKQSEQFKDFYILVLSNSLCHHLSNNLRIDESLVRSFDAVNDRACPASLSLWKKLIELLLLINRDDNIANKLMEFKKLIARHKSNLKSTYNVYLTDEISVQVHSQATNYQDFKNVILLFQSVSYITNCYDKKANFSSKFLPKVREVAEERLSSSLQGGLPAIEAQRSFYAKLVEISNLYICIEALLLGETVPELPVPEQYRDLLLACKHQRNFESNEAMHLISKNLEKPLGPSVEVRMIMLCNAFGMHLAKMNKTEDSLSITDYDATNSIWQNIETLAKDYDFADNHVWQCTLALLWVIARFQPFSNGHLASNKEEDYLEKVKWYFSSNKMGGVSETGERDSASDKGGRETAPTLKKSALLRVLLNYVAGSMLVHDIETKCTMSNACFHLCGQQDMPLMSYLIGIWHLLNCGIAMRRKEVVNTRQSLLKLVDHLVKIKEFA